MRWLSGTIRVAPFAAVKSVEGPHRRQLDVDVGREREEVEAPVVAVEVLRAPARADRDGLREMQLERGLAFPQRCVGGVEHERVGDQGLHRRRAGEQRAGAPSVRA